MPLSRWRSELESQSEETEGGTALEAVASHLQACSLPHTVIVDCTASEEPPARYLEWMQRGIHIVTPNKMMGSGPLAQYQAVRRLTRSSYAQWYYEVRSFSSQNRSLHVAFVPCSLAPPEAPAPPPPSGRAPALRRRLLPLRLIGCQPPEQGE